MLNSSLQFAWRSLFLGSLLCGIILVSTPVVRGADGAEGKPSEPAAAAAGGAAHGDDHGGHGGGHHDENDLSHANATPELTSLQELRSDLAIWTFVLFLVLFAVLAKFAWGPILKGLRGREESMARLLAEAQSNAARSEAAVKEHEAKLAAANEEARSILADARRAGEELRESIVTEARGAAQRERDRAIADIAAAKQSALSEIADTSVRTAIGLAGRILKREIGPQDQERLAREAADQFASNN